MADLLGPVPSGVFTRYEPNPRTAGYIPHLDALGQVGECFLVKDAVTVINLRTRLCRIETMPRLLHPDPDTHPHLTGYYARVVWYFNADDVCKSEHLRQPPLNPPVGRTHVEYPTAVVESMYCQWIRVETFASDAAIITKEDMDNGNFALCVGMENCLTLVGRWDLHVNRILPIPPGPSPFYCSRVESFTRRKFLMIYRLSSLISVELSKSSFQQRVTSTKRLPLTVGDWEYLKERFLTRIEAIARPNSVCTVVVPRKFGSKEAMKSFLTLEAIRADTRSKIDAMACIFGRCIRAGVRVTPRVRVPLRRADRESKYATVIPVETDHSNGFFHMPRECNEPFKLRTALPRIDLIFNPLTSEITIRLRFFAGSMAERAVKRCLNSRLEFANINGTGVAQQEGIAAVVTLSEDSEDSSSSSDASSNEDDGQSHDASMQTHESSVKAETLLVSQETEFEANGILFLTMKLYRQRITDRKYLETIVVDPEGVPVRHVRHACRHWFGTVVADGAVTFRRLARPSNYCEFIYLIDDGLIEGDQPTLDDCVYWNARDAVALVETYNQLN